MPRGQTSEVGATMVNQNGYHHTKTEAGWRLTHHIIAEQKLGRPIQANETAYFRDGDRANLDPKNIDVRLRASSSIRKQIARLDERIRELKAQRTELANQLEHRLNEV